MARSARVTVRTAVGRLASAPARDLAKTTPSSPAAELVFWQVTGGDFLRSSVSTEFIRAWQVR